MKNEKNILNETIIIHAHDYDKLQCYFIYNRQVNRFSPSTYMRFFKSTIYNAFNIIFVISIGNLRTSLNIFNLSYLL